MDINVGIKGKDFVMLLADTHSNRSIFTLKHDEDKITKLDDMKLLACSGEQSSRVEFSEFVQKNLALYRLRNDVSLSNAAAANYIRHQVAEALRTRSPFQANSLFAGYDDEGASLYYLDYLGSLQEVNFTAHGYAAYFCLSLLDRQYKGDLTQEDGLKLMKEVIGQLRTRFIMHMPTFMLKTITKDGITEQLI